MFGSPQYKKLSPGPGKPASDVAANQRARIQSATIEIVGEEGYDAVTVRRLSSLAGVSTRTFYQHFEGKEECFLRTYELVVQRVAARIISAQAGEADWRARLELAFAAFAREIANKPRAARLALVEVFGAGPAALDAMSRTEALFECMVSEGFEHAPGASKVSLPLVKGITAGVTFATRERMMADDQLQAPELAAGLLEWTLSFANQYAGKFNPSRSQADLPAVEWASGGESQGSGGHESIGDREMILAAVAKLAAANGYWRLTVPRILAAAGLRKKSFTSHFNGVEDCFLAALEQRITSVLQQAMDYSATSSSWSGKIYRAIESLCTQVASDPITARLILMEVRAAGTVGLRRRSVILSKLSADLFCGFANDDAGSISQTGREASVGAVWGLLAYYVASERQQQLPELVSTLSFLVLAPALGSQAAVSSINAEQGGLRPPIGQSRDAS